MRKRNQNWKRKIKKLRRYDKYKVIQKKSEIDLFKSKKVKSANTAC